MATLRSAFITAALVTSVSLLLAGCGGGGDATTTSEATAPPPTTPPVTNQTPTISGTPSTTVVAGSAYSFQPTASDTAGTTLTFSAMNLPSWAHLNAQTGLVSGTPAAADVGTDANIKISVSDGTASASLAAFSIAVTAAVGTGRVTVSWTPPTQNSDGSQLTNLSGYQVVYGQSASNLSQSVSISDPTATTYTINNLTSGTWYFGVRASSAQAESDVSTPLASKTI